MLWLTLACVERSSQPPGQLPVIVEPVPFASNAVVQDRIAVVYDSLTDVILVVPQDGGSESLRLALAQQDQYLSWLGGDARLAVASAHPGAGGALVGEPVWLTSVETDALTERLVSLDTLAQSPDVLTAARLAVEANAAELRPEARLDVILATHGTDADGADETLVADAIAAAKDDPTWVAVHCLYESELMPRPCDLAERFDGVQGPVDSATSEELGFRLAGFPEHYALSRLPGEGTLEVEVEQENGVVFDFDDEDWTYDAAENTVRFVEYVPDLGSTVILQYEPRDADVE